MGGPWEDYQKQEDGPWNDYAPSKPYFSTGNARNVVSDFARPVLEIGGAVGGGVAGLASPVPGGTAIGGAVGYAGGKSAADLLDRYLGTKNKLGSLSQATLETGRNLDEGMKSEILGQAISHVVPPIVRGGLNLAKKGASKLLPAIFKTTAGIPEKATEIVINNPDLLNRPKITDENLNDAASPIIEGLKKAKQKVGESFGRVYKKITGLENPIDDFINDLPSNRAVFENRTSKVAVPEPHPLVDEYGNQLPEYIPPPPGTPKTKSVTYSEPFGTEPFREAGKNLDDLRLEFKSAKDGTLFKKSNPTTGGLEPMTNQEKLVALTTLKRQLQSEASKNLNGVTLHPIDTVQDAAIKKMISEVDDIRTALPNGKRLAIMDNAWSEIRDIYAKVQKDFSEPGKARDTLMRLIRGESNWMTQGRNAIKINAIKQAEKLIGKELLKPALEELASALYQQPIGYGIKPAFAAGPAIGSIGTSLLYGRPDIAAYTLGAASLASPKAISLGLRLGSGTATAIKTGSEFLKRPGAGLGLVAATMRKKKD